MKRRSKRALDGFGARTHAVLGLSVVMTLASLTLVGPRDVWGTTSAQQVSIDYANLVDDREIKVHSLPELLAKRRELIQFVWGSAGFPSTKLPVVERSVASPIGSSENLQRVHRLRFLMDNNERNLAYHLIPRSPNNRVVIVHQGHACTLNDVSAGNDGVAGMINTLLADGFDVIGMFMPHYTPEDCRQGALHSDMFGSIATGSPMKFFLEPVAMTLNYLKTLRPAFRDYSMTGISGGGWTTSVYSAIDPTIRLSFPVAGSVPLYLRPPNESAGDTEQVLPDFYRIAGYLDLYLLGSSGDNRKQVKILNRRDQCCFGQYQHPAGVEAWEPDIRAFEIKVRTAAAAIGPGSFRLEIDEPAPNHTISDYATSLILREINGGGPDVGATSKGNAFIRGPNGNIWHWSSAGWNDIGLATAGVPAVLEGGRHTFDLFFRDPGNRLKHAYFSGAGWAVESTGGSAISDPIAVSEAPGWMDIVIVGTDYRLYHLSWRPEWSFIGFGRMSETAVAQGTPVMVSSALDRRHVFFRGSDRRVYQLRWDGSFPWTLESVTSDRIMDFPSAAVTHEAAVPTLRVHVRATDNRLTEMWQRDRGLWNYVSVSRVTDAKNTMLSGSPDTAVSENTAVVYQRTSTEGVAAFTLLPSGWQFSDKGGRITGSPTAVPGGAWARGLSGDLQLLDGSTWVSKAGVLQ